MFHAGYIQGTSSTHSSLFPGGSWLQDLELPSCSAPPLAHSYISAGLLSKSDTVLRDPLPSITGSQQGFQRQLEGSPGPDFATTQAETLWQLAGQGQGAFRSQLEDCLGTLASLHPHSNSARSFFQQNGFTKFETFAHLL